MVGQLKCVQILLIFTPMLIPTQINLSHFPLPS